MRSLLLTAAAALLLGCPASSTTEAAKPTAKPTPADHAAQTRQRLIKEPLRWTARQSTQADYEIYVENQHTPHGWRRQLRTIDNGREALVIDLVEKDGLWHVLAPKHLAGVYRPFEAPLEPASHLELLDRARLRFIDEERRGWTPDGAALVARERISTDHLKGDEAQDRRALLEPGAEWLADPATGWITSERFAALTLSFSGFRWEEDPDLSVPRELSGEASTPVEAPMLISRCFGTDYRLPCEADALIIDPANPRIERRVPARGMAIPIAILDDRKRVIVLRRDARGQQPVLVELGTGTETPLGGEALAWQFALDASLTGSPARLELLVAAMPHASTAETGFIELTTPDRWQSLGSTHAPLETPLSEAEALSMTSQIVERAVRAADQLAVRTGGRWYLQKGGRRQPLAPGLRGAASPAVSPDGTELYFVRKDGFRFVAHRIPVANPKKTQRIPLPPGRYERPIWR